MFSWFSSRDSIRGRVKCPGCYESFNSRRKFENHLSKYMTPSQANNAVATLVRYHEKRYDK